MIYLNGKFLPIEQAYIPVLDRGFIFGDGVYEVIPVYSCLPFRLDEHLARLQHSLDGIRLANPYTVSHWRSLIESLVAQNEGGDQYLYLHITRGTARRDHAFPAGVEPTVFMMSTPLAIPGQELLTTGVAAITAQDNRWGRCDIKAISLLPNVLLRQLAVDACTMETILLRDGLLTEGAASNIFIVRNDVLLAPPKDHRMLPGITYDLILELAAANAITHEIRDISEYELRTAKEIMLTSSTKEILPIVRLDGQPVGSALPGAVFRQLNELYQNYKATVMRGK
ncbi:D-amino acid aminotransferase [Nitrosomonas mobilis]|uniref:Aminotransferases class-IV n=1 Tax=Nitrosomonas mobilis TaxID=51642 RepID=A0A1G5SEK1_9PROT|nr:D-amino acid aminotransferase [Nitrosomonas mobilis]SCZ85538.1 Aminotransferases class-IV [Nitrosomonas mobilis]HNO75204.1 D-amino acid aminotransferase [Nitrosomonas mobilis]